MIYGGIIAEKRDAGIPTIGVYLAEPPLFMCPQRGNILATNYFQNSVARDRNSVGETLYILVHLSLLTTFYYDKAKSKLFMHRMT